MGLQAMQPLSLTLDAITVHRFDTAGKGSNEQAAVEDNARKDEAKLELVRWFLCVRPEALPLPHRRRNACAAQVFCQRKHAILRGKRRSVEQARGLPPGSPPTAGTAPAEPSAGSAAPTEASTAESATTSAQMPSMARHSVATSNR